MKGHNNPMNDVINAFDRFDIKSIKSLIDSLDQIDYHSATPFEKVLYWRKKYRILRVLRWMYQKHFDKHGKGQEDGGGHTQ